MASTNYYTVKIHSYRFCVSYIDFSVSRVGPTRTAYSIFYSKFDVNYYIVNLTSIIDFYKRKEGINKLHTLEFLEFILFISAFITRGNKD